MYCLQVGMMSTHTCNTVALSVWAPAVTVQPHTLPKSDEDKQNIICVADSPQNQNQESVYCTVSNFLQY